MEEWEYCLLWASPRKTIVVKPGGQVETYASSSWGGSSDGILVSLQADGWKTVAFNATPTVDMTYLFKRRVRSGSAEAVPQHPSAYFPMTWNPQQARNPSY